jgi:hypothetical protein
LLQPLVLELLLLIDAQQGIRIEATVGELTLGPGNVPTA